MLHRTLTSIVAVLAVVLAAGPAWAAETAPNGTQLAAALQQGGVWLIFRHAATEWSNRDEGRSHLEDCSTQRNLSDAGREDARHIGAAVRALGIPIGGVWASPFCRTRETAQLAFGSAELTRDLMWPGMNAPAAVMAKHKAGILARLGSLPPAGKTNVLVTHGFVIHGATGENVAEGEALVVRPGGGDKFELLGRIKPEDWPGLVAAAKK